MADPPPRLPWAVLVVVCAAAFAAAFFFWLRSREREGPPILYDAPRFAMTDQAGRRVTDADLRGHAWAVCFVFTHCASICPTLGSRFVELSEQLPDDFKLVSVSVDPERDTPARMLEYSQRHFRSVPGRWHWLTTGDRKSMCDLLQTGFKVGEPGVLKDNDIPHSPHVLLIDGRGRVRGTYVGTDLEIFRTRLLPDAKALHEAERAIAPVRKLPTVNAGLNGTCAVLLVAGFLFIRSKRVGAHKACMITACVVSLLFLASYLTYHHFAGSTRFTREGWIRPVYFTILISHTVLAALIVPMVIVTLVNALRGRFERHRGIARWTLPAWMYVSVTGVVVYVMLYLA